MEFQILGPLEAREQGRTLWLGGAKQRALLAMLLLTPNQVVSVERLIEALWGADPPVTARQSLQNQVSALRKLLEPDHAPRLLVTRDPGYLLRVDPEQVDLGRFRRLAGQGLAALAAGEVWAGGDRLRDALALWRGPALADLAAAGFDWPELASLDELRLATLERRIEADLALGRQVELVAELEALVQAEPLRERLHGQLMLALYRSGRQADALAAYRAARQVLVAELGIEPGAELQRLEQAILAQDPALAPPPAAPSGAIGPGVGSASTGPDGCVPASGGHERKPVTVLFASLPEPGADGGEEPGADGGERDPEDVERALTRHLAQVRSEVERFGGTVEQVIGGTSMAAFGVPATHEDDPERALRAAVAIRDGHPAARGAADRGGGGRIAIATGTALVALDDPRDGRPRLTGTPVIAGSRLLEAVPAGAILVDDVTWRATRRAADSRPAGPPGPGRPAGPPGPGRPGARPPAWEVLALRPHGGPQLASAGQAPLIEREQELAALLDRFARARAGGTSQLVTLIGAPGMGKSRLVAELRHQIRSEASPVVWRQGRSLPYGAGVTFWALAEIVKAHAGILESDTTRQAEGKLVRAVTDAVGPGDAAWVAGHLRPLVAPGSEPPLGAGRRAGAFTAWRRFLDGIAGGRPLVLVFEDLHWADDALLDFIDGLAGQAGRTPLLVVGTSRPELLERRPGWGGRDDATTIVLTRLSEAGTAELLDALLDACELPAPARAALLTHAGGIPLFAEEYVRMLRDRGVLSAGVPAWRGPWRRAELPLPASVHALIAARLDLLPAGDKAVLRDAAVLGKVGWVGALAAIGGHDRRHVQAALRRLEARQFLRLTTRSTVAGEHEYAFRHILVRDVAYDQIPRAQRADKHRRAAAWIEALALDRAEDRAELLAHHYQCALEFARAAGQEVADLAERARLVLRDAGDRAAALHAYAVAVRFYAAALELWPADDRRRADLLYRYAEARFHDEGAGAEALAEARDALLAVGDAGRAAEAEILLSRLAWFRGDGERTAAHVDRALALVRDRPPSWSKATVLIGCARHFGVVDRRAEALRAARAALRLAERLGLREIAADALGAVGTGRVLDGDAGGIADLEQAIAQLTELGSPAVTTWHANLGAVLACLGDVAGSIAARAAARQAAEHFGSASVLRWLQASRAGEHYWTGRWPQAVQLVDGFLADGDGDGYYLASRCRIVRGRIRLAAGALEQALQDAGAALEQARQARGAQVLDPALAFRARVLAAAGQADEAAALTDELLAALAGRLIEPHVGVDLGVLMVAFGHPAGALEARGVLPTRWREAVAAFAAGDLRRAAERYAEIGSLPDEAFCRLLAGERLAAAGAGAQAEAQLGRALAFYGRVGAAAAAGRAQAALAAVRGRPPSRSTAAR